MQISISEERLTGLKNWLTHYISTFRSNEPEIQQNLDLKEDHTFRVCEEIIHIGEQLGLNIYELRLAQIIAMFHDVGRFEQYVRYKTFSDRKSENHSELGIKILEKHGILESFDSSIKDIILKSIKFHNRPSLPQDESETCLFYSKLIRDADKLDILKVVTDYYHRKDSKENGAIGLDLPDTPGFSEEIYYDLKNKRIANIKNLKNLNDFKLYQIGWIFDINFQPTLDSVKFRRYIELIRDVLPESSKIDEVIDIIYESY